MKGREETGRVIAVALVFFGALAAAGAIAGVFERLGATVSAALGMFGAAFAVATYFLDAGVRDWVSRAARLAPRPSATKAPAKSPGGKPAAT